MKLPRWYAAAGPAYLAALLAVDTQVSLHGQLALGALTWLLLLAALRPLLPLARAQALAVVLFATAGEITGTGGSPHPVGFSVLGTMWTSTVTGASMM